MPKFDISKEKLTKLYVDQKMTIKEIAEYLGHGTIKKVTEIYNRDIKLFGYEAAKGEKR